MNLILKSASKNKRQEAFVVPLASELLLEKSMLDMNRIHG